MPDCEAIEAVKSIQDSLRHALMMDYARQLKESLESQKRNTDCFRLGAARELASKLRQSTLDCAQIAQAAEVIQSALGTAIETENATFNSGRAVTKPVRALVLALIERCLDALADAANKAPPSPSDFRPNINHAPSALREGTLYNANPRLCQASSGASEAACRR